MIGCTFEDFGPGRMLQAERMKDEAMLGIIAAIVIILWLGGFALHIGGGLIHLLLVIGVILLVLHFVTGRRVV